jgi:hypothetical protein
MKNYEFPILQNQRARVADLKKVEQAGIRAGPAHIGARIGVHRLRHIKPSDFCKEASI